MVYYHKVDLDSQACRMLLSDKIQRSIDHCLPLQEESLASVRAALWVNSRKFSRKGTSGVDPLAKE
jgi:hypothetical protein